MPITLGCPSCGKRFRARDESAGKKVKCPYCQAAVPVPPADEAASAGAPTAPIPASDSAPIPAPSVRSAPPPRPTPPAAPPVVVPADEWGVLPVAPSPPPPPSPFESKPPAFPAPGGRGTKDRPAPAKLDKSGQPSKEKGKTKDGEKSPEEILARGWTSVRRGLFWVQFALLWLSIIGCVGFGKAMFVRAGNELPKGDGSDWVSIEGYINSAGPNAVPLTKTELMNLALYAVPVLLAGVCVVFGRLVASGAPRSSGARGLFSFSALFGLIGFGGLISSFIFERLLLKDEYRYTWTAFLLLVPLAEFWFLSALTASGVALKRPRTARAVGVVGFGFAVAAFVQLLGWDLYVEFGRPKKPDDEIKLYEQAGLMVGWLLLVMVYWRAVRNVRSAAREFIIAVEDRTA